MQVLSHFPLLKALGWALFNSLWQMAALWLLYSFLMAIFHSAAARIRHTVAFLLLTLGTVWTAVTFLAALLTPANGNARWLTLLSPAHSNPGWFWLISRSLMDTILSIGSTLYLLVLSLLLVRYSSHYLHSRKLARKGLSSMPPDFRVFVHSTALQLNIRRPVGTWLSSLIDVPLTLGFLKPVILLPVTMMTQLTPAQVEAILIHELGHIQRNDYLLHLVVTLLEGLFFFNPFTRLLIRQLKKEQEHCCDDLVLQFKYDPQTYVTALLTLATGQQPVHHLAVAATGGGDKLLLQRARRILLRQEDDRSRPVIRMLALLLFTGLIATLALYRPLLPARKPASAVEARTPHGPASAATQPPAIAASTKTLRELGFIQPLHSSPPPVIAAPLHQPVRPGTHRIDDPEIQQADDNDLLVSTADNVVSDDNSPTGVITYLEDANAADNTAAPGNRDYSLNMPAIADGPGMSLRDGDPIVPNSSFSFQYTLGDSTRPDEQLLYLQQSAQQEVLAAMANLEQQTAAQMKMLSDLQTKAGESLHLRKEIRTRQQQLQLQYLKKIAAWQKKLEKTTRIRMIVYI